MSIKIVVPQVGEAISAARLVQWYKQPGDFVRKGEPLFAVDTDKAILDVEAFSDGILEQILIGADADVQPEMVVGLLRGVDEEVCDLAAPAATLPTAAAAGGAQARGAGAREKSPAAASAASRGISPKARRLALELGVDLATLAGGPAGSLITEREIRAAAAQAEKHLETPETPAQ